MTTNYTQDDAVYGAIDLDEIYVTDDWLINRFTGNGLWTCGYNLQGQLGNGNITYYSSPIQVGSLTNWKQISCGRNHTAAIKTDGTLWTFGQNTYGQLGTGNITMYSSPIQVGTLTNWKQIAAGLGHTVAIINMEITG